MAIDPLALRVAARYAAELRSDPTSAWDGWTLEPCDEPRTDRRAREVFWRTDGVVEVEGDDSEDDDQT